MSSETRRRDAVLRVAVIQMTGRTRAAAGLARWLVRAAPARARGTVTVALLSDDRVRALNRRYRGVDRVTDVLSFATAGGDRRAARGEPTRRGASRQNALREGELVSSEASGSAWLGDVVIAVGRARRQAREAGHSLRTQLRVLALHGLLHLLGYDHVSDDGRMARLEQRVRRRSGLSAGLIERTS